MIRKANIDDIPRLLELLLDINKIHVEGRSDIFNPNVTKFSYDDLKDIIENNKLFINVYTIDNLVIGYLMAEIQLIESNLLKNRKIYFIHDFCIDSKYRHHGIGKELFKYSKEESINLNCDSIELNVWSFNDSAIKFYESLGFKVRSQIMELNNKK